MAGQGAEEELQVAQAENKSDGSGQGHEERWDPRLPEKSLLDTVMEWTEG